jgi:hypothetical protein
VKEVRVFSLQKQLSQPREHTCSVAAPPSGQADSRLSDFHHCQLTTAAGFTNAEASITVLNKAEATSEDLMRPRYCSHDVIKRFEIFWTCHHL